VLHADDIKNYRDTWNNSVETGEPFQIEYRFKEAATGHYRWHLGKALPIRDRENRITKWFGTCTDIHDQKTFAGQLENLVAERTRALQRSNEDLQQFAHVASHDLKEPVRKIRTFSGRMKEEFAALLPEKASLYLTKIEKGADRMYDMIDGVLLYSSMEAMEQTSEEVDINDLMENIQADLEVVIVEKEAVITIEQIPPVEGAPILLYQLFYNLINNSLKFAKPNERPRITITSEVVSSSVAGELGVSKEKTFVRMILQDNGIGFAQSDAERIFKTFLRLNSKDKFEGTGLGLSLCKKIVERHGGSIWAQGTPGEGAVFNILLPAFHESVM
jgi:light-regulated signal transduction histidine kinase (bacteriophytochrome)